MASGKNVTEGTRNSGDDEVISETYTVHILPLFKTNGSSLKEPVHTFPKFPLSAIPSTSLGISPTPLMKIVCKGVKALLKILMAANFNPTLAGLNRMMTSIEPPGLDSERIGRHAGHQKIRKRRCNFCYQQYRKTAVINGEDFISETAGHRYF